MMCSHIVLKFCRRELELSLPGVFAGIDQHIYNLQKNECGILIAGMITREHIYFLLKVKL